MTQAQLMVSGRDFGIVFVRAGGLPPNALALSEMQVNHELRSAAGNPSALFQLHDVYAAFCHSQAPASYDEMAKQICLDVSQGWLVAYRTANGPVNILIFSNLWESYPRGQPYPDPTGLLDGNQCAVKMSVGLAGAGILLNGFSGETVTVVEPQGPIPAAIGAGALARWLEGARIVGLSKPEDVTGSNWRSKINDRQGIVYFSGYWPRNPAENADPKRYSGDHIDLWNGSRLEISSDDVWAQGMRQLGINKISLLKNVPFLPQVVKDSVDYHDLDDSKQILFWEIK